MRIKEFIYLLAILLILQGCTPKRSAKEQAQTPPRKADCVPWSVLTQAEREYYEKSFTKEYIGELKRIDCFPRIEELAK